VNRYEQAAREMEALKDTPAEVEGLIRVKAKGTKHAGVVYSLRLTGDEFLRISAAAKASGMTLAAYLRSAALLAADGPQKPEDAEKAVALQEVREKTRELAEAVQRL
jgi:hypothetical protein